MKLSKNFILKEFLVSNVAKRKGIELNPDEKHINNLQSLVINVLQPLRDGLSEGIRINSGYRSEELNRAIGGSKTSQHCKGQAADIRLSNRKDNEKIFKKVLELGLDFDQMINEFDYTWIHISFRNDGENRKQLLEAYKGENGKTKYKLI
tara:strand:+ start:238 stop:687 length:450 start_codon:yes stop_codon:yes gene_type:complete